MTNLSVIEVTKPKILCFGDRKSAEKIEGAYFKIFGKESVKTHQY